MDAWAGFKTQYTPVQSIFKEWMIICCVSLLSHFFHCPDVVTNDGQFPTVQKGGNELMVTGPLCRYTCDLIPLLKIQAGPLGTAKLRLDEHVDVRKLKFYSMGLDERTFLASKVDPELRDAQLRVSGHSSPASRDHV